MKTAWWIIGVTTVLAALLYVIYLFLPFKKSDPEEALPAEPLFVLEIKPGISSDEFSGDPVLGLLPASWRTQIDFLEKVLPTANQSDARFLAFYLKGEGKTDLLLTTGIPDNWKELLESAGWASKPGGERNSGKGKIYTYESNGEKVFVARENKLWIMSTSSFLVESALSGLSEASSLKEDVHWQNTRKYQDENKAVLSYLNLSKLMDFLELNYSSNYLKMPFIDRESDKWFGFTATLHGDELGLSGYWVNDQQPEGQVTSAVSSDVMTLLPPSTVMYKEWLEDLDWQSVEDKDARSELEEFWSEWVSTGYVLAYLPIGGKGLVPNLLVKTDNPDMAMNRLQVLADGIEREYRSFSYQKLQPTALIRHLTGYEDSVFCTTFQNYILFSPSYNDLKSFIDARLSGRSLYDRSTFKEGMSLMLSSWKGMVFLDIETVMKDIETLTPEEQRIPDIGVSSILWQLNPYNDTRILHAFLFKGGGESPETFGSWVFEMDAAHQRGPFIVYDQLLGTDAVVIQDSLNQLYLIGSDGNLQWKKLIDGPIVGEVTAVDFYLNNKIQLLFTTQNAIQLVDMNGNDVEGFPIRLSSKVSSGVSVLDYLQNGDYRMFVGCDNNNIYGFYKNGKPLPGWKPLRTGSMQVTPMMHMLSEGKDFLVYTTAGDQLFIRNRKGSNRTSPVPLQGELITELAFDSKEDATMLLGVNENGDLVRYYLDGTSDKSPLGTDIIDAVLSDVDGDGSTDVVYMDQSGLHAITNTGMSIFNFDPGAPSAFRLGSITGKEVNYITLSSIVTQETYILDGNGKPIHSEVLPASGYTNGLYDPERKAVIASGSLIQCFVIR